MAATYRSVSTANPSGVTSINVTKPSGAVADDVLIAAVVMFGDTAANVGTPTGGTTWTLLDSLDAGTGNQHTKVFWKAAGASEPANYAFPLSSSAFGNIGIVAISGANASTPLHASGTAGSGTTLTTPTLTPSAADDLEVRVAAGIGAGGDVTWTAPGTYTLRVNTDLAMATKSLSSGSATGTQNFTASDTLTFRHGFTIDVATLVPFAGRSVVVTSRSAVRRASSF